MTAMVVTVDRLAKFWISIGKRKYTRWPKSVWRERILSSVTKPVAGPQAERQRYLRSCAICMGCEGNRREQQAVAAASRRRGGIA